MDINEALNNAYIELFDIGVVSSHNQFSRDILRKSSRYMSYVCANKGINKASVSSAITAYAMIDHLCDEFRQKGRPSVSDRLDHLSTQLWDAIRLTVLTIEPHRRRKQV